jgi:hypothetical protein
MPIIVRGNNSREILQMGCDIHSNAERKNEAGEGEMNLTQKIVWHCLRDAGLRRNDKGERYGLRIYM